MEAKIRVQVGRFLLLIGTNCTNEIIGMNLEKEFQTEENETRPGAARLSL